MFYPVHFELIHASHLQPPRRQRHPLRQLLHVYAGSLLLRLGREEILLPQGHSFWLPADCLHALSVFQGSDYARVSFSVRVRTELPAESGFLEGAPLVAALLDELRRQPADSGWQGMQGRLLRLLADLLPQSSLRQLPPLGALTPELRPVLASLMARPGQPATDEPQADRLAEPFRATLGLAPWEWQQQWRLLQSLVALKQGQDESGAAESAGFASLAQWQAALHRYMGHHPRVT